MRCDSMQNFANTFHAFQWKLWRFRLPPLDSHCQGSAAACELCRLCSNYFPKSSHKAKCLFVLQLVRALFVCCFLSGCRRRIAFLGQPRGIAGIIRNYLLSKCHWRPLGVGRNSYGAECWTAKKGELSRGNLVRNGNGNWVLWLGQREDAECFPYFSKKFPLGEFSFWKFPGFFPMTQDQDHH